MDINVFLNWLAATSLSEFINESSWAFAAIESLHVIVFVLVVGSIAVIDFRLLGLSSNNRTAAEMTREILPLTWSAYAVAIVTGALMITSSPAEYYHNLAFRLKFLFMALAGVNMLIFHFVTGKNMSGWEPGAAPPVSAKVAGALSLSFWIAVVVCGRWIGFTKM